MEEGSTEGSEGFDAFKTEMIGRLRAEFAEEIVQTDEGTIEFGGVTANLVSLYEAYNKAPPELQQATMLRFVGFLVGSLDQPEELSFEEARPRLRPKVWARWMFASMALKSHTAKGDQMPSMPTRLIGEHLILSFVLDSEDMMSSVDWNSFCNWGRSFEEVLEIAIENADKATVMLGSGSKDGEPGQCMMATEDNYDSIRFLSEKPYTQFEIGLPRWSFSAGRDNCVICSADDAERINTMLKMAFDSSADDPKQLPPFPLVDHGKGWTAWKPTAGQEIDGQLADRQRDFFVETYAEQRLLLQRSSLSRKDFAFVETISKNPDAQSSADDKESFTFTTWQEGTECLLPEADFVDFPSRDNARIPWSNVLETCPELLAPAEAIYPTRWRTYGFPNAQQFGRMTAATD